ncbi:MAG: OmpH family outer membrane protein [Saprospirales bacterium]|nr:OmpH family outer membrane protein [Saprospirales bacterium]MBK8490113.1 OmpH family outer membrane protein [Saprospirales bacterium]
MKKTILLGVCLMSMMLHTQVAEAQTTPKYAYVTSGAILEKLPEMEQMKSNLQGYQAQLQKKGEQKYKDFQAKQVDAKAKKDRGELSPVQEQQILEELQKLNDELVAYDQQMQDDMLAKQEELLTPILEKVNNAIKEISKEEGYTMVFDLSSGAVLFADETSDITPKVIEKLGITE